MAKILLIEDEELIVRLLKRKLTSAGHEVTVASDGEEGLRKMKETEPDMVLCDIIMPRKGGFEVLEEMSKDAGLKTIPVMIISNSGQPSELDQAKRYGVVNWLIKTEFDPQEVVDKINNTLGGLLSPH